MSTSILVIEDHPANLELILYLLTAYGYTVEAALDGERGLAAAQDGKHDLIICDVQLPVMDGLEVARRIVANPARRTAPLIAVTALAMVGDRERVLAAGFDGYIAKPISPNTFVKELESFLRIDQHGHATSADLTSIPFTEKPIASHTILVIDDCSINQELARSILEPHGYAIYTARGMTEALRLAKQHSFDLILSDVWMDEGSGYDLIQAIKADDKLRAIPFIFLTSTMLDEQDRYKGLSLGASRFLIRPIDPTQLLKEIQSCLVQ